MKTWTPYEIKDGRCVMSDAAEWSLPKWQQVKDPGSTIAVVPDIFEPWNGEVLRDGSVLFRCKSCGLITPSQVEYRECGEGIDKLKQADINRDIFAIIDQCPNLIFVLETRYVERVLEVIEANKPQCPFCESTPCDQLDECNGFNAFCYRQSGDLLKRPNIRFQPKTAADYQALVDLNLCSVLEVN